MDSYHVFIYKIKYALENDKAYNQFPLVTNVTFSLDDNDDNNPNVEPDDDNNVIEMECQPKNVDEIYKYTIDDTKSENMIEGGSLYSLFNYNVALHRGRRFIILKELYMPQVMTLADEYIDDKNRLIDEIKPVPYYTALCHGWLDTLDDKGFRIVGDSMTAINCGRPGTSHAMLGKVGFNRGIHRWDFVWNEREHGTHPVIGIGQYGSQLHSSIIEPLVGSDADSYGWHLGYNKCIIHDFKNENNPNRIIKKYPDPKFIFWDYSYISMILDMEQRTLSFMLRDLYIGVAFRNLPNHTFYPMVSTTWCGAKVHMRYVGSYLET